MTGAPLPDGVHALWPELQIFRLRGTGGGLRVIGQVTDVKNDRSQLWMDLAGVEVDGRSVWLDQPVRVIIPADLFGRDPLSPPSE